MRYKIALPVWVAGVMVGQCANALDTDFAVELGTQYTNNALKTRDDTIHEWQNHARADLALNHKGKELLLDARYGLEYFDYDNSGQKDESRLEGDALLRYEQIPDAVVWRLSNSRRNIVQDKAAVDIGDNREDRSVTTAGVDLTISPLRSTDIITSLYWGDISYEDSEELDSQRPGINVALLRKLSPIDSIYLQGEYEDVSFDESESNDYEYYSWAIGYQANLSKLSYELSAGFNEQKTDSGEDFDGAFFALTANYKSQGDVWGAKISRRLTDTSRGNNNQKTGDIETASTVTADVSVYEISSAEFTYETGILCAACRVNFSLLAVEEDYESVADDNRVMAAAVRLRYKMSARTQLDSLLRYKDFYFSGDNLRPDSDMYEMRLGLTRDLSRSLKLNVFLRYQERSYDEPLLDYDETLGGASIQYSFL